ncbi:unnamed protein product [Prorocentrum cordatum]|uniref:Reverse transcriptase RNase H-like domain-containing protein n=1 Tax=Prorocentrum cordatum TaxID=2364126 RepID=A0ABN9R2L9_9DINO|nr:unnamed protein product [Polarella glacialis]
MGIKSNEITNMTGEIMAVIQALMWLISTDEKQHAYIYTDCKGIPDLCDRDALNGLVDGLPKRARCLEGKSEWVDQLPFDNKDTVRDNEYYQTDMPIHNEKEIDKNTEYHHGELSTDT